MQITNFVFRIALASLSLMIFHGSLLPEAIATPELFAALRLKHGSYSVGYRAEYFYDNSRSFKKRMDYFGRIELHNNRPIQMHLWYPASVPDDGKPILYQDYIEAAIFPTGIKSFDEAARNERVEAYRSFLLERDADPGLLEKLLKSTTRAYRNATPLNQKFPLLIYAPSINSDSYENSVMIEFLVSHGYVVVSAPSMGLHGAEVSRDVFGAEAQLGDLELLLSRAWELAFVDPDRILTVGFSWGGMTNVLLAMKNSNIRGVVSLDGAIGMEEYLGIARSFPCFSGNIFTASYLQVIPGDEKRDLSFFETLNYSDARLVKVRGVKHRDFASDAILRHILAYRDANGRDAAFVSSFYKALCHLVLDFSEKVFSHGDARQEGDLRRLQLNLGDKVEMRIREKLPVPPNEAEFLEIIRERGSVEAVRLFHEFRSRDPKLKIFSEKAIIDLVYQYGPEQAQELIPLLEINLECYPHSAESCLWLAQSWLALERREKALEYARKALELDKDNQKAHKLIGIITSTK